MVVKTFFVSGHLDTSKEEFFEHYVPRLAQAVLDGCAFVVGDAHGTDFMAQRWLHHESALRVEAGLEPIHVVVFHMLERPRHSFGSGYGSHDPNLPKETWTGKRGGFPLVGGFESDEQRDAAMTRASDADIAWVRPHKSKRNSGTQQNLDRRAELRRSVRLQEIAQGVAVDVGTTEIWPHHYVRPIPLLEVRPDSDPPLQAMTDDGMPIIQVQPRVPQEFIDRMAAAWREYQACQEELRRLLAEQGVYP